MSAKLWFQHSTFTSQKTPFLSQIIQRKIESSS